MLGIRQSHEFEQDLRRLKKEGNDLEDLMATIRVLQAMDQEPLPQEFIDAHNVHALRGEWAGHDELHIEGDWLLIYIPGKTVLRLVR